MHVANLQELCVEIICDNLNSVFEQYFVQTICETTELNGKECVQPIETEITDLPPYLPKELYKVKYRFKCKDTFLHAELAQYLLKKLCTRGLLNDETLSLFTTENTRLEHVTIKDAKNLTCGGLRQLYNHKITKLECVNVNIPVQDIIRCLGKWSTQNLTYLNVSHCTFLDRSTYCLIPISSLKNIHILNVSYTEFNRLGLEIICQDLKFLESLNISVTKVTDISPLKSIKDRLTSLSMFSLLGNFSSSMIPVILELHNLTYLDISRERPGMNPFEIIAPHCDLSDLLKNVYALPNLLFLDISGKQEIDSKDLEEFLLHHQKLQFLGLMFCDRCMDNTFTDVKHPNYKESLVVSGMANIQQILIALNMYTDRPIYVQKSLYYLFRLSYTLSDPRPDIIELVLKGMAKHPDQFGVQMAATACLYNLTKRDLGPAIHITVLKRVVDLTLDAMQNFPSQSQIQKNALLTLCSDRILQDVNFEKFRCAKLVILALCSTDDPSMNRMAVAIISILAAKITTDETSLIGSVPMYMKKLLSMIRNKVTEKTCDITLKFTLSALWNLTDESSMTCRVFLKEGGIDLFLEVLVTFCGESSIETKVLGLINNIAEVNVLRSELLIPKFILKLRELLNSEHIDVSYFAAGIIAHLTSDGVECWAIEEISRSEILDCLGEVVANWKTPDGEMVAYRSFGPFFPLLSCAIEYQIQLWAVWAIHHVCTKNPARYCQMLIQERGNVLLENIVDNTKTHSKIKEIALQILETLHNESHVTL